MAVRDNILQRAHYWADPGEWRPDAETMVYFFEKAGLHKTLSLDLAQKSLDKLSLGMYIGAATDKNIRHWCGIFACCVLAEAGVAANWSLGKGSLVGSGVGYRPGTAGMQPGDVAIIARGQHHFILTNVDRANNKLHSVDGNTQGQYIRERDKQIKYSGSRAPESIYGYYTLV